MNTPILPTSNCKCATCEYIRATTAAPAPNMYGVMIQCAACRVWYLADRTHYCASWRF